MQAERSTAGFIPAAELPAVVEACSTPLVGEPIRESAAAGLAQVFKALGDPVRLRLLGLVAASGEVCSCDLVPALGKSQPTVSHHTKILTEVGLIVGDKRGRWVWWSIVPERLQALRDALAVNVNLTA